MVVVQDVLNEVKRIFYCAMRFLASAHPALILVKFGYRCSGQFT